MNAEEAPGALERKRRELPELRRERGESSRSFGENAEEAPRAPERTQRKLPELRMEHAGSSHRNWRSSAKLASQLAQLD